MVYTPTVNNRKPWASWVPAKRDQVGEMSNKMGINIEEERVVRLVHMEHFPPFAEAVGALLKSWEMVRNLPVKTIYPAHGEKLTVDSFSAEYEFAIKKYR